MPPCKDVIKIKTVNSTRETHKIDFEDQLGGASSEGDDDQDGLDGMSSVSKSNRNEAGRFWIPLMHDFVTIKFDPY